MMHNQMIILVLLLPHSPPPTSTLAPPPNRSLVRGTKAASSDIRTEATNGLSQGPKLDGLEAAAESKNCSSAQRGGSPTWASGSQPQPPRESKLEPSGGSDRKALRSPILQKTSSAITLQPAKVQLEPRAPVSGTLLPSREERERPAAPPAANLPSRQSGTGGQEAVSKAATKQVAMESRRAATVPRFESKPQSQEVSEDQPVKFKCEGE